MRDVTFRSTTRTVLCAILFGPLPTARAQTLVYEGFNYSAGTTLNGHGTGVGWSSAWQTSSVYVSNGQDNAVTAGSINFGTLSVSGNRLGTIGNDVRSFRQIDTSAGSPAALAGLVNGNGEIGVAGTTVWIGFLGALSAGNNTNTGNGGFHLFDGLGNLTSFPDGDKGHHEILFMGDRNNPATGLNWCLEMTTGGTGTMDSSVVVSAAPRFLVYKIDFLGGRNGRVSLFIDPTPGTSAGSLVPEFVTNVTSSATVQSAFQFNYLEVGTANSNGVSPFQERMDLEEFRVGASYDAVSPVAVPEPTEIVLFGMIGYCGLGCYWWRRREKILNQQQLILALIGLLLCAIQPAWSQVASTKKAISGDSAPGGGVFSCFDSGVALNNIGQVAFYGSSTNASSGIFSGLPGNLSAVALQGGATRQPSILFHFLH